MIATYENERVETMATEMAGEMGTESAKAKTKKRKTKKPKSQIHIHVAKAVVVAIVSAGIVFITQRVTSCMFS